MRAYGVFQGGGAKGYAHIGALKAAEGRNIEFEAVAGTSIGAVIAALVAAGYRADELLKVDGKTMTGLLAFDPLERLDQGDWKIWTDFRERVDGRRPAWIARIALRISRTKTAIGRRTHTVAWLLQAMRQTSTESETRLGRKSGRHRAIAKLLALYLLSPRLISKLWIDLGITSNAPLGAWLDSALTDKVQASHPDRRVRFRDVGPLKIVATELNSGSVEVFSRETHPEMPVVDAVLASACFPLFFRPVEFSTGVYVDGGLTSNLPAWVFDQERGLGHRRLPTFGFRLIELPELGDADRYPLVKFLRGLLNAALGGAAHLETRQIDDCHIVDLVPDIDTLAFDQVYSAAPRLLEAGRRGVEQFFESRIGPKSPERVSVALEVAARLLRRELEAHNTPVGPLDLRILLPDRDGLARYSYSSTSGVFDRLATAPFPPSPASCLEIREPILLDRRTLRNPATPHPLHRVELALRGASVGEIYAVPVFENAEDWSEEVPANRSVPIAVLVIESESDLGSVVSEHFVEDRVAACAQVLGDFLMDRNTLGEEMSGAEFSEPEDGRRELTPHSGWVAVSGCSLWVSDRKRREMLYDAFVRLLVARIESRVLAVPD